MRYFLLLVAFVSSVSFAETNIVDLSEIEQKLDSISSSLDALEIEFGGTSTRQTKGLIFQCRSALLEIQSFLNGSQTSSVFSGWVQIWTTTQAYLSQTNSKLDSVINILNSHSDDLSFLEDIYYTLEDVYTRMYLILGELNTIRSYTSSLPQIEAYQQTLALIVSNINNIVSDVGVTVNLPSSFNVSVDNFPSVNFNPAWDWQNKYINGTGEQSSETLVWQNSLDLTDNRSTRFRLFPDMHNDVSFASWAGMLYKGLDNGFESLSSSGVRSVLLLNSISNINAQIYNLLSGLSPNTNLVATTDEQTEAASALRSEKLTTDSLTSEISSIDYTPNIYAESIPNIGSRPRLSGVVSAHDTLSETASFDLGFSGFFQTATDMGYTQFSHPDTTVSIDMRPANDVCIAVRQVVLLIFWIITIIIGSKLCLTVYSLYQTIWVSLMSSDSDIGAGQTVNTINYMRHILP